LELFRQVQQPTLSLSGYINPLTVLRAAENPTLLSPPTPLGRPPKLDPLGKKEGRLREKLVVDGPAVRQADGAFACCTLPRQGGAKKIQPNMTTADGQKNV